jgi:hypothetical protein
MKWRDLIQQYLAACAADDAARIDAERVGRRQQFMATHASTEFIHLEEQRLRENTSRLSASPSDSESFQLIEETDSLMIVEVKPGENQIPHATTRFQLVIENGRWVLDDYLWKCQCENGDCNWCGGSGDCAVCGGDGNCKFCDDELTCQLCKGEGKCSSCATSKMPGWNTMKPKPKNAR